MSLRATGGPSVGVSRTYGGRCSRKLPGQQRGQGGEHRTVSPVRLRAGDLSTQDRDFVPQYEDLRVLRGIILRKERGGSSISGING